MAGRSVTGVITATPPAEQVGDAGAQARDGPGRPLIMKMDTSRPAALAPEWRKPSARAFPPRALLLRMNCRSDPWPESFTLTIVLKLKPKSTLTRWGRRRT